MTDLRARLAEVQALIRSTDHQMPATCREAILFCLSPALARALEDAERWQAVIGSARIRWLGAAGLSGNPLDPNGQPWNGYAHIGMEFWTKHPCVDGNEQAAEMFTRYADAARTKP